MSLVAVVGAGETGGAAARALALRSRVSVVRLIDETERVATGKALDLMQSRPVRGSDTRVEGAGDLAAASGATAIVLADSAGSTEWSGEPGLGVLRRLLHLGCLEHAVVICAGAAQRALMQRGFDELGLSRRRVVGSAPEALAATARALVAIEAGAASNQITLTVLGNPPDKMVIPWEGASVGGHSIASLLTASQLHQLERRVRGLWPPGPNALGTAAALFCEAVAGGSRRLFSGFVSLDRDNGTKAPVCAWSVSIGPGGLERMVTPTLTRRDRVVMDEVLE
jgi:malate/lactate dehydrogenase